MAAHKHAAILKAYADNADLVIFMLDSNLKWHRTNPKALMDYPDDNFFACLPQHENACLHWLNGGDVKGRSTGSWINYCPAIKADWNNCTSFMDSDFEIAIKPRKEKRHIYISTLGATTYAKKTKEEAAREVSIMGGSFDVWKHYEVEIEVEV